MFTIFHGDILLATPEDCADVTSRDLITKDYISSSQNTEDSVGEIAGM